MEVRQQLLGRVKGDAIQAQAARSAQEQRSEGERVLSWAIRRTLSGWAGMAQGALWASSKIGG